MKQTYQISSFTQSLFNLTRCPLRRLGLAGICGLIATSLALLILPSACAQSIEPLYGNLDNVNVLGPSNTPALAPLNLEALPGWFVSAACAYVDGNEVLRITVWQDSGTALNLMGSYNYPLPTGNPGSPAKCGNASVVSMYNTSASGDTTIVAATVDFAHTKAQLTAFQVGPTGSVTPIGTPAIPDGPGQSADWITITRMSESMALIEYDAINPSMPDATQQYLVVDSFEVPASGDIAEAGHLVPSNGFFDSGMGDITRVNDTQAVVAVMDEFYGDTGQLQYGTQLIAFNVDDKGNITIPQEGVSGAGLLDQAGGYAMAPSIAQYFLGSSPSVITAYLGSNEDLELATFSLSSSGVLTPELTLTWDPVAGSAPFPSVFFIPDDNLAVVAEYGGNGQLDMNVFDQNGSGLYELTSYHSGWKYNFNATPQGVTAISDHRVATALPYDLPACNTGVGLDDNCPYALEVWEFKPKTN